MSTSWYFHAVCATNEFGFRWLWQFRRADGSSSESKVPFDYYYDCIEDARKHGFRGPFPAGSKVPLSRLAEVLGARPRPANLLEVSVQDVPDDPTFAASVDA